VKVITVSCINMAPGLNTLKRGSVQLQRAAKVVNGKPLILNYDMK